MPQGAFAPAVWVDRPGRRVLQLGWSLTGTTEPSDAALNCGVPRCPTSIVELNLPVDQVPTASSEVLLTGPFEVRGKPARRLWRLRFGGRSKVEFAVRAAGALGASPRRNFSAYDLTPGQLAATFEYELHPVRIRERVGIHGGRWPAHLRMWW